MHILIAGSYGMGNTGDEAILASILDQLRTKIPQAIFRVVAGDPQYIHDRFSVEAVPLMPPVTPIAHFGSETSQQATQ